MVRTKPFKADTLRSQFRHYFYGFGKQLRPYNLVINFAAATLLSIDEVPMAAADQLPLGVAPTQQLKVTHMPAAQTWPSLVKCVLAVSYARTAEEVPTTNIAGLVYVMSVDREASTASLLTPSPSESLPGAGILLVSDIKFWEL